MEETVSTFEKIRQYRQEIHITSATLDMVQGLYSESTVGVFISSIKALAKIHRWIPGIRIEALGLRNFRESVQEIVDEFKTVGVDIPETTSPEDTGILVGGDQAATDFGTNISDKINALSSETRSEILRLYAIGALNTRNVAFIVGEGNARMFMFTCEEVAKSVLESDIDTREAVFKKLNDAIEEAHDRDVIIKLIGTFTISGLSAGITLGVGLVPLVVPEIVAVGRVAFAGELLVGYGLAGITTAISSSGVLAYKTRNRRPQTTKIRDKDQKEDQNRPPWLRDLRPVRPAASHQRPQPGPASRSEQPPSRGLPVWFLNYIYQDINQLPPVIGNSWEQSALFNPELQNEEFIDREIDSICDALRILPAQRREQTKEIRDLAVALLLLKREIIHISLSRRQTKPLETITRLYYFTIDSFDKLLTGGNRDLAIQRFHQYFGILEPAPAVVT